ncbi:MAG: peptide chain release factor 2 [Acholeplasmataceae bacterium]|nr:peptide chain release factor 2 [Acholeplasmataceae bacterium]
METYEVNKMLNLFKQSIEDMNKALQPTKLEEQYRELNLQMQQPNFWNDTKLAKKLTKESTEIHQKLESLQSLESKYKNLVDWFQLSEEGTEEWVLLEADIHELDKELKAFEIETILNGPYDSSNAIIELHPGAGGTESQDWCDMLYRMYTRYAQKKRYKIEVLDYQAGDEAGIKSVTMLVKGPYAYGYLKAERGVHRLVRISPFDSNARRHTSFASCDVLPEIDDDIDIDIKDEDIKVDVYRSGGAGGQSVNTTDSAVRITHLESGIVVTCQNERSQLKNKESAMSVLKAKLVQEEIKKQEMTLKNIQGEQKDIAWGSQIRSYVFHPYQMVKDHRTNYEVGQVDLVMDGELDGFINAYLKAGDDHE